MRKVPPRLLNTSEFKVQETTCFGVFSSTSYPGHWVCSIVNNSFSSSAWWFTLNVGINLLHFFTDKIATRYESWRVCRTNAL